MDMSYNLTHTFRSLLYQFTSQIYPLFLLTSFHFILIITLLTYEAKFVEKEKKKKKADKHGSQNGNFLVLHVWFAHLPDVCGE